MTITAPPARALTNEAVTQLHNALDGAGTPGDFLSAADAIVSKHSNHLQLRDDLGTPDPLAATGRSAVDVDNAPLVHDYIGEMDRSNASDPRLWTYLAIGTYRDYMEARWPLEGDAWRSRAKTRWLLATPTRGLLVRHGIARLWWIAHLTYDPHLTGTLTADGDPYGYTRAALATEDRIINVFDRLVGAHPAVVRAVLDHTAERADYASERHIRDVMRALTLVAGYRDIGTLDQAAVSALVADAAGSISRD